MPEGALVVPASDPTDAERRPYTAPVLTVESDIGQGTMKAGNNPEAHTAYSSTGVS